MFDFRYCNSFATLYTKAFLRRVVSNCYQESLQELLKNAGAEGWEGSPLGQILDHIYSVLIAEYRCEYIYKNELAVRLMLERHDVNAASLFTEFAAGRSKADVVIANGTTTAYEIKTELDSVERLVNQVRSYQQVFDRVCIVTHPRLAHDMSVSFPASIGLLALEPDGSLTELRAASSCLEALNPDFVFDCLRAAEYTSIVDKYLGPTPSVPNTKRYLTYKEKFVTLEPSIIRDEFTAALRNRFSGNQVFITGAPRSLKLLSLTSPLSNRDAFLLSTQLAAPVVPP